MEIYVIYTSENLMGMNDCISFKVSERDGKFKQIKKLLEKPYSEWTEKDYDRSHDLGENLDNVLWNKFSSLRPDTEKVEIETVDFEDGFDYLSIM